MIYNSFEEWSSVHDVADYRSVDNSAIEDYAKAAWNTSFFSNFKKLKDDQSVKDYIQFNLAKYLCSNKCAGNSDPSAEDMRLAKNCMQIFFNKLDDYITKNKDDFT